MNRSNVIYLVVFNAILAVGLCIAAQLLAMAHGLTPSFSMAKLGINFLIAWPVAMLVSAVFPAEKFGAAVCTKLHIPQGLPFGIGMNISINLVFTAILAAVMTLFNVVILGHQGAAAFFAGYFGDFIPMWACSCIVSALAQKPARALAGIKAA